MNSSKARCGNLLEDRHHEAQRHALTALALRQSKPLRQIIRQQAIKNVFNGGLTSISGVPVQRVQPGIFETSDSNGRRYAVLLRADGSYVTPTTAARRGEVLRMFATGLGVTNTATDTNRAGVAGQNVVASTIVGVNDAGVRVVSAAYAPGMIGVYLVDFEVPADTQTGTFRSLAIALDGGNGNLVYGQGSAIAAIQ